MKFRRAAIEGALMIKPRVTSDERGSFARVFSVKEFAGAGVTFHVVEASTSVNMAAFTIRGMHYQRAPAEEAKVIRCSRGALFDVIVDIRRESPTYRRWEGYELTQRNGLAIYVPPGCAHGYLTLADDTQIEYLMAAGRVESQAAGVRWDDPAFAIDWPARPAVISDQDANWPDFLP